MRKLIIAVLIFCFFPCIILAAPNKLLLIKGYPITNELMIKTAEPLRYHYFFLTRPDRLVIDFENTLLATSLPYTNELPKAVSEIDSGNFSNGNTRIVLQLVGSGAVDLKSTSSALILKFQPSNSKTTHHSLSPITTSLANPTSDTQSITLNSTPPANKPVLTATTNQSMRPVIIVIDAGHGGKDPGAAGPNGVHEKNVVLAISEDLYDLLKNQPGIKPVMTRSGDYYIPLRGRLQIARDAHADLFVAIHADSFPDPSAHGASVFALSLHGATSEAARWLAERENYSELGGANIGNEDNMVRSVLINLSQTATINDSLQLGSYVLHDLDQLTRLHHPWVEQAPFMVLKSPDIPSILVETGFISNAQEEQQLDNPDYQVALAQAIKQGILQYLHANHPQGTWFDHE